MERTRTFWVVGGDRRQVQLARLLALDGHTVSTYALEQEMPSNSDLTGIEGADCVIFPLPVCSAPGVLNAPLSEEHHPLSPILDLLLPKQLLCGGRIDPDTRSRFARLGLTVHDYFAREELTVANAIPTAEGAVQIAMEELPITIHGARVAVIGFGRVGKVTAQRFAALGATVTVVARSREQLAWAQVAGMISRHMNQLPQLLSDMNLVINTVPAPVLGPKELTALHPEALIIDLASAPGGVDMAAAAHAGVPVIHALALPGKVAPVTAGTYLRDTVYHILQEADI